MSHLTYYNYKSVGERNAERNGYNQAVRVGEYIHLSGQGGWNPDNGDFSSHVDAQIDQAFRNVDLALKTAGGKGWEQVFRVNSYHVILNDAVLEAFARNFAHWMPNHKPLWTCVGVTKLGEQQMLVEVEVQAHDPAHN
ncbi:putative L-PSP endoribonuclease family protein [Schizophyllum fasciatum]